MTATDTPAAVRPVTGAIVNLCLIQFLDVLGVTVVVTALPDMLDGVGAGPGGGTLVATGDAMFFGGLLMLGARLGDRIGHRRTIVAATALFAIGSAVGAAAPDLALLTAARCLQGAAAAAAVPSALRLLTSLAPDERTRARALAGWSAAGAAAGASGFVVGGVVTALAGWRVIFVALVPAAGVLALAVLATVPADRPVAGAGAPPVPLNLPGAALLTSAVMAAVGGATALGQPSWTTLGAVLLGAAALLAGAFVRVDRRASAPLLPGHVLRHRPLRRGTAGGFLNTATTNSAATLTTLYVQNTLGRSALVAAATLLPISLAALAGSALAAPVLLRVRLERVVAGGLVVIAAGDAGLVLADRSIGALAGCSAAIGLGLGLSSVAANALGTAVREEQRATASGVINTAAQLGTALGVAGVLLVAAASSGVPAASTAAPALAWGTAAAAALGGAVWFGAVSRRPAPSR